MEILGCPAESKFEYDKISKEHLKKNIKGSPGTPSQDYANSLDLNNPKTLLQILEFAGEEQRSTVVEQLQAVTVRRLKSLRMAGASFRRRMM